MPFLKCIFFGDGALGTERVVGYFHNSYNLVVSIYNLWVLQVNKYSRAGKGTPWYSLFLNKKKFNIQVRLNTNQNLSELLLNVNFIFYFLKVCHLNVLSSLSIKNRLLFPLRGVLKQSLESFYRITNTIVSIFSHSRSYFLISYFINVLLKPCILHLWRLFLVDRRG